ncbi:hypothetical protein B0A52_03079 [Exophiala mesophila]|uniref:Xylanolytic transcriptional activator regulatory domain-containing protein n=1 Tax=Exophiala mesophila TaxID=212818 RepID=A0A438NCC9_EXOME|nr:hypothetical protein B0A52_03079 [Exophiala mesophila]
MAQTMTTHGTSNSGSTTSPSAFGDERLSNDDDWWYKDMDNLWLTRSGERRYVGSGSSTYLAQKLNPTPATDLAWDVRPMYRDSSSLKRPKNLTLPQLPPYDFARRLYLTQNKYIGSIFWFAPRHTFEPRLRAVYSNRPNLDDPEARLNFCVVLLVLTFGHMFSVNQWSGSEGPPGFNFFKDALWLLPEIHQEGSMLFVQVLSLTAWFMQNLNRKDAAFLYVGLAIRMAISLGLHQEVTDLSMDLVERESRRRIWWSVYSLDRIISVKSGNPISIHDEDIDVAWPVVMAELDSSPSIPTVLKHYTQLSRILGRIGEGIYRKKNRSGTGLLSSVQSIMDDLSNWLKDLPPELSIDTSTPDKFRECVCIFLHYYYCIDMTARPFLLYVAQKRLRELSLGTATPDWREGLSPNILTVIENAIAAARGSAMTMSMAMMQNEYFTYGFMDGEHSFACALTLIIVNVAFPYNERDAVAMKTVLAVLRSMAEKGNEYIQARYTLLLNLRTSLELQAMSYASTTSTVSYNTQFPSPTSTTNEHDLQIFAGSMTQPSVMMQTSSFQPLEEMSFNFDVEENSRIWEEISGNIDIDMDTGWIENAIRRDNNSTR